MTLEQLRIFVCVAQRLNMTRAAEALHITQSGVSASISALEASYGTPLFDRVGRRIELSAAGQVFLVEAEKVLDQVQQAQRTLADLSNLRRGAVSICASPTIGNYWLPALIADFHARFPQLGIKLAIANQAGVARMVQDGDAELGFVEGGPGEIALTASEVGSDRLCIVVPPNHPWAKRAPSAAELARGTWVLHEADAASRSNLVQALSAVGVDADGLDVRLELPTVEAVRAAIQAGAGAGVMSELAVRDAEAAGLLARAPLKLPRRAVRMLRHDERKLSRAAEMFVQGLPAARRPDAPDLRLVVNG